LQGLRRKSKGCYRITNRNKKPGPSGPAFYIYHP
jgi:hypothetical protein